MRAHSQTRWPMAYNLVVIMDSPHMRVGLAGFVFVQGGRVTQ